MTRSLLVFLAACFGFGVYAGTAEAANVYYNGGRVTTTLVGGISATPCGDQHGCVRGIVELRYRLDQSAIHHVRCLHPKQLHVVGVTQTGDQYPRAVVWACRRTYHWRLP